MPIAKKPGSNRTDSKTRNEDAAAEAFISGAGKPTEAKQAAPSEERANKIAILTRFAPDVLSRVDAAARHRGISRSAWIQFVVSRALDQGEG